MHKIDCLYDILRRRDETLKIVEAIAEHGFCSLRLIGAFGAKEYNQSILYILSFMYLKQTLAPHINLFYHIRKPAENHPAGSILFMKFLAISSFAHYFTVTAVM